MLAEPAALVVMLHDALADGRLRLRHARAALRHHAAGLVPADHRSAGAAEPQRGGGAAALAGRAIRMQIAPAHAGGLHLEDDLAGAWLGIREVAKLQLTITEKDHSTHDYAPLPPAKRAMERSLRSSEGLPSRSHSAVICPVA